ncbi:MAG: UDP-2,3-diacylglucosamine hydrolase [Sulfuricurvum sp.]|uniref:UDP-2,3-diacylglucosamine diphosphatase n=1 Tax=Sulfuricurvum sp. TaxID=2025608 RepID=UPI002626C9C6|nr:UDP-2,3-diacylglucosamine hydrolase [Sulfuricurvum sp.]MDD2828503.1 UDP-2,3-diacylglucosamine hydrolase [Sulfuricurvum sp.]MDD4948966.1 UDP-2,3-diacylglucosamine hydrolase [Sulfuricurvum sp.]
MYLNRLQEGAILIADSHAAPWRTQFIDFLHALDLGEIQTPQLILMGDNFDLLFGPIPSTHTLNEEGLNLLNRLSQKIEIWYFEGNHDFRLTSLFPHIRVIPLKRQPFFVEFQGKQIALLHGDIIVPLGYRIYTALIRNSSILALLNLIDTLLGGVIIHWLCEQMQRKRHCKKIENFEHIAQRFEGEMWLEECDMIIEGHYHQNRQFHFEKYNYINLGAFACNERIYVVKSSQSQINLEEVIFQKEPR